MRFGTVALAGVGLLGGSLGLALKHRGLADTVRGLGRRREPLDIALGMGAIDEAFLDPDAAFMNADLVVLCTPAALVPPMLDTLRGALPDGGVVTDVASTKAEICRHARDTWPQPLRFVGSHPMAGSEKFGPEHATPGLYEGCVTVMEPADGHAPDAWETVRELWESVGSRVVVIDPTEHDRLVARTSHLPHVAAACLARVAASADDARAVAGGGFRDTTRVAEGRPEIWRDICLTNREALLDGIDALGGQLATVRRAVETSDADALETFFREGGEARRKVLGT
jgi:prephenate dehydrogenase